MPRGRGVLVGAALLAASACATASQQATPRKPPPATLAALPACATRATPALAPAKLAGPAHGSVRAGRVVRGWSLDGGAVRVSPAGKATPALSQRQAACNLVAALTPNNVPLASIVATGSVLGYGRLTVSTDLPHDQIYPGRQPLQPTPPVFRERPAWILTVAYGPVSSCPAMPPGSPPPGASTPRSWLYQVYAIDAATGRDAMTYVETRPTNCTPGMDPASSAVPYEQVSVPWKALSVNPGRRLGTIEARYADCEFQAPQGGAWVAHDQLQVQVARRIGPPCGATSWHQLTLHPRTVRDTIPAHLAHAPVGPIDHD